MCDPQPIKSWAANSKEEKDKRNSALDIFQRIFIVYSYQYKLNYFSDLKKSLKKIKNDQMKNRKN